MKSLYSTAISVFAGLTVGNFICQAVMKHEWGVAAERSFFQLVAIALVILLMAPKIRRLSNQ